jgi:hypothetical protein
MILSPHSILAGLVGVAAAAVSPAVYAQPVPKFGDPAEIAISSDAQASLQLTSGGIRGGTSTSLLVAPAIDYFVIRDLSLGIQGSYSHVALANNPMTDSESIGLRVGYDFPLTDLLSFWPRLGLDYSHSELVEAVLPPGVGPGGPAQLVVGSVNGLSLVAFAPLLLHPVPHAFLGLGPSLDTNLVLWPSGQSKVTHYGLMFTLGIWFGGRS